MLTKSDFHYNFFLFRIITALKIIPVDFDGEQGILKVAQSPWKRRISLGLFGMIVTHGCFIFIRLLQALMNSQEIVRHHLVFHVDVSFAALMIQGWYLSCFVLYPDTFVGLFNEIFTISDGNDESEGSGIKARSRQEWFALAMPMLIVLVILFAMWLFNYDRSLAFLLYSALSEPCKTPFWFRLLFCQECHLLSFIGSNAILVLVAQLLFFEKITASLKMLTTSSRLIWTEEIAEGAYNQLKKIQLQVSLFNNINRHITFSFKLYCIGMCTLNGYFMIVYFSADPIFGTIYYVAFGILCMLYSIMYERAFAIPKMVRLAKSTVLLRAGAGAHAPGFKRTMERRLRSVPEAGIQVGHFHSFERVATPVFVDYVLRNVMGLLSMHLNN